MKLSWPFAGNLMEVLRLGNVIRLNDIKTLRKFLPASPRLVLDVGSNDAFWSQRMTKHLKVKVIYVDLDLRALKIAKSRGLTVVCADAAALPFRSAAFNCVYSVSVYQLIKRVHEAFAEAHRVLGMSGHFCFCVDSFSGKGYEMRSWRAHHAQREGVLNFFSREFSSTLLSQAGFKVKQQFCVLGNGWWRLFKMLYRIGPFQVMLWPILYPLTARAYRAQWDAGHKLFALAAKDRADSSAGRPSRPH